MHSGGQFYQQPPPPQQQQQREPPPLETPSQTIYVNHINQKIKPNVLKEHLQTIFSKYGTILELHVRKSYKTRGQAWVTYENMDDAKKAQYAVAYAQAKADTVNNVHIHSPKFEVSEILICAQFARLSAHDTARGDLCDCDPGSCAG